MRRVLPLFVIGLSAFSPVLGDDVPVSTDTTPVACFGDITALTQVSAVPGAGATFHQIGGPAAGAGSFVPAAPAHRVAAEAGSDDYLASVPAFCVMAPSDEADLAAFGWDNRIAVVSLFDGAKLHLCTDPGFMGRCLDLDADNQDELGELALNASSYSVR